LFEEEILGGVLWSNLESKFDFRVKYHNLFSEQFDKNNIFSIVKNIRGHQKNHKIVILFQKINDAQKFIEYMFANGIYVLNGYRLLCGKCDNLPVCVSIDKKVVELPIEDDDKKMHYLISKVKEFIDGN